MRRLPILQSLPLVTNATYRCLQGGAGRGNGGTFDRPSAAASFFGDLDGFFEDVARPAAPTEPHSSPLSSRQQPPKRHAAGIFTAVGSSQGAIGASQRSSSSRLAALAAARDGKAKQSAVSVKEQVAPTVPPAPIVTAAAPASPLDGQRSNLVQDEACLHLVQAQVGDEVLPECTEVVSESVRGHGGREAPIEEDPKRKKKKKKKTRALVMRKKKVKRDATIAEDDGDLACSEEATENDSGAITDDASADMEAEAAAQHFILKTYADACERRRFTLDSLPERVRRFPTFQQQARVASAMAAHDVVLVEGSTGCGKSSIVPLIAACSHYEEASRRLEQAASAETQLVTPLPEELLEEVSGAMRLRILVTQPTRFACLSLASYCTELVSHLPPVSAPEDGGEQPKATVPRLRVGYAVAGERRFDKETEIIFATPGYLLQHLLHQELRLHDRQGSADVDIAVVPEEVDLPTHLIIDEAHCRDTDVDLLLAWARLQMLATEGTPTKVKLIVMSATIDVSQYTRYFNLPPSAVLNVNAPLQTQQNGSCNAHFSTKHFFCDQLTHFPLTAITDPSRFRSRGRCDDLARSNSDEDLAVLSDIAQHFSKLSQQGREDLPFAAYVSVATLVRRLLAPQENIVIFVPGYSEMMKMVAALKDRLVAGPAASAAGVGARDEISLSMLDEDGLGGPQSNEPALTLRFKGRAVDVVLLHSTAIGESTHQLRGSKAPCKVIIATNVAESSVTLPEIKYVIDFATERFAMADPVTGLHTLSTRFAAQANMAQRRGRTGRTCDGFAVHLLPEGVAASQPRFNPPQSLREGGEALILRIKRLFAHRSFNEVLRHLLEAPADEELFASMEGLAGRLLLTRSDCLESAKLTDKGAFVASLPIEVQLGTFVLTALHFGVVADAVIIAAGLNVFSIFNQRTSLDRVLQVFTSQSLVKIAAAQAEGDEGGDASEVWALRNLLWDWYKPTLNSAQYIRELNLNPAFLSTVDVHVATITQRLLALLIPATRTRTAREVAFHADSPFEDRTVGSIDDQAAAVPAEHPWFDQIRELVKLRKLARSRSRSSRGRAAGRADWVAPLESNPTTRIRVLSSFVASFLDNLMIGFPSQQGTKLRNGMRVNQSLLPTDALHRICALPLTFEAADGAINSLLKFHMTDDVLRAQLVPRLEGLPPVQSAFVVGDGATVAFVFEPEQPSQSTTGSVISGSPWVPRAAPTVLDGSDSQRSLFLERRPLTASVDLLECGLRDVRWKDAPTAARSAAASPQTPLPRHIVRAHLGVAGLSFASRTVLSNLKLRLPVLPASRVADALQLVEPGQADLLAELNADGSENEALNVAQSPQPPVPGAGAAAASTDGALWDAATSSGFAHFLAPPPRPGSPPPPQQQHPPQCSANTLPSRPTPTERRERGGREVPTNLANLPPAAGTPFRVSAKLAAALQANHSQLKAAAKGGTHADVYMAGGSPVFVDAIKWCALASVSQRFSASGTVREANATRGSTFCPFCHRRFSDEAHYAAHLQSRTHVENVRAMIMSGATPEVVSRVFRGPESFIVTSTTRKLFSVIPHANNPFGMLAYNPSLRNHPLRHAHPLAISARLVSKSASTLQFGAVWPLDMHHDLAAFLFGLIAACSSRFPLAALVDETHSKVVALMIPGWLSVKLPVPLNATLLRLLYAAARDFQRVSVDNCLERSSVQRMQTRFRQLLAPSLAAHAAATEQSPFVGSTAPDEQLHWCALTPEHAAPPPGHVGCIRCAAAPRSLSEASRFCEQMILMTLHDSLMARRRAETLDAFVSRLVPRLRHRAVRSPLGMLAMFLEEGKYQSLEHVLFLLGCVFFPKLTDDGGPPRGGPATKKAEVMVFYLPAAIPSEVPRPELFKQLEALWLTQPRPHE